MSTYPKWVQRDPSIGPVLCANEEEAMALLTDWKRQKAEPEAPAEVALPDIEIPDDVSVKRSRAKS